MRSFQLLNKKNKQEFKKIEQMLKGKDENGREVSINKNCTEMDKQIPLLMGVSNSILENVIFCHQEESLWPFSDQANLKKIFDEIFETSKYTKALIELRNIKKQYNKFAKDYKTAFEMLGKDYENYQKLKKNEEKAKKEYEENKISSDALKQKMSELEKELNKYEKTLEKIMKLDQEISSQKMMRTQKLNEFKDICKCLGVEDINDPSLNDTEEFKRQQDEVLAKKEHEKQKIIEELKETRKRLNEIITEKGSLQGTLKSKQERFEFTNGELVKHLDKIFGEMQEDFDDPYQIKSMLSSKKGEGAYVAIQKVVDKLKVHHDAILAEYDFLNSKLNSQIDDERKDIKILETQLEMQRQTYNGHEQKLQVMKQEEENTKENTKEIEQINNRLAEISLKLKDLGVNLYTDKEDGYKTPKKIRTKNQEIKDLSEKKNNVRSKIESLEADIESKQSILKTLEKLTQLSQRKLETTSCLSQKTSNLTKKLKEISKLKLKQHKSDLLATTNSLISTSKVNLSSLISQKHSLEASEQSKATHLASLQSSLTTLQAKKQSLLSQVSSLLSTLGQDTFSWNTHLIKIISTLRGTEKCLQDLLTKCEGDKR
jgi:DNA repair protein RAD50